MALTLVDQDRIRLSGVGIRMSCRRNSATLG